MDSNLTLRELRDLMSKWEMRQGKIVKRWNGIVANLETAETEIRSKPFEGEGSLVSTRATGFSDQARRDPVRRKQPPNHLEIFLVGRRAAQFRHRGDVPRPARLLRLCDVVRDAILESARITRGREALRLRRLALTGTPTSRSDWPSFDPLAASSASKE